MHCMNIQKCIFLRWQLGNKSKSDKFYFIAKLFNVSNKEYACKKFNMHADILTGRFPQFDIIFMSRNLLLSINAS